MNLMRAVVVRGVTSAEELRTELVPIPEVKPGWVLVKVKAFGLNRSEVSLRTVEAGRPYLTFPRIPGIECVGEVADPSDSGLTTGQPVAAMMGGMGRDFDGSYAEYALLPVRRLFTVKSQLPWSDLAAIPETYYTAWGSLFQSLRLRPTDSVLIRGATSALGQAAAKLARAFGCKVAGTTRKPERLEPLHSIGVTHPLLENDDLEGRLETLFPRGVDKILDLVGSTWQHSLGLASAQGVVCQTGLLGGDSAVRDFSPLHTIPNGVCLTAFHSNFPTQMDLDDIFSFLDNYSLRPLKAHEFALDQIAEAHRLVEDNRANGKVVITV